MRPRTRSLPVRLLSPAVRGARAALDRARGLREIHALIRRVRPYTMVHDEDLIALVEVARSAPAGAFVECGTWRGGSSFLMALADPSRRVWMFDSFEGLPAPGAEDGPAGAGWTPGNPWWQDNVRADIEDVRRGAARLGVAGRVEPVKGWFSDTLPSRRDEIGPIALLRLDADLYTSTRDCLENLWDLVVPGGSVILDDYYYWDGCAAAVHEFLGSRRLGCPIWPLGEINAVIRTPAPQHREGTVRVEIHDVEQGERAVGAGATWRDAVLDAAGGLSSPDRAYLLMGATIGSLGNDRVARVAFGDRHFEIRAI